MEQDGLSPGKKKQVEKPVSTEAPRLVSATAEYILRAMAYLSQVPGDTAMRARDLAAATGVPAPYLSKIMRRIAGAGIVIGYKGSGGGFTLARAASDITLAEVLAAVDYKPTQIRCVFGWGHCDAQHPCRLHAAWAEMSETHQRWAPEHTLAELGAWVMPRRTTRIRKTRAKT